MNGVKKELYLLRWNLLVLFGCLLVAGAAGMMLRDLGAASSARAHQAMDGAARIRSEALRLQNEEQDMREKIALYQGIAARGIIGPERRLDWIEQIRTVRQQRKLLDVQYELLPQISLPATLLGAAGDTGHDFMVSTMRVTIPLLHEEDLLHFVADVKSTAPAYVRVRECALVRPGADRADAARSGALPTQINAECLLDWITVQPRSRNGAPS